MAHSRSLLELAYVIQSRTHKIYDTLHDAGLPQLSFPQKHHEKVGLEAGQVPEALQGNRAHLLEAIEEMRALILGPSSYLFYLAFLGPAQIAILRVVYKYRIAQHLPLNEPLSFEKLSQRCGLSEANTTKYVRAAITLRIFEESPPGIVRHNATSTELATTLLHDFVGFAMEDIGPSAHSVGEALEKYPDSEDPSQSAYSLAHGGNGERDIFSLIANDVGRVERLSKAMSFSMAIPEMSVQHFIENVPWASGGINTNGVVCPNVVVDVGGSRGTLCTALLRRYPGISKAIAVDLPEVVEQAGKETVDKFGGRLEFTAHSFFDEQVIRGADAYIFRCVFHDWADPYVVRILRNQIPALKPGARIIINERCLEPPDPSTLFKDQFASACNIYMQVCANAKERSREDWARVLTEADERFEIISIVTPRHSALSLIEVLWNGTATLAKERDESRTEFSRTNEGDLQKNDGCVPLGVEGPETAKEDQDQVF
ncbi:S-adenosyl-L-methionine-dependent methyltransferase [Xylariaceae sp. FL0255]|nr:S-adenosyl-L-methionine-dependent methyltransferase [Xylariaceae sp. FL0255]